MRIVLLHGWLRGNLGDYSLARRLVSVLRARFPRAELVLCTQPRGAWPLPEELLASVDSYLERPYADSPEPLLRGAAAAVNVPGGGLQDPKDARGPCMLRDARICHELGVRHAFAGHSFHPSFDLEALRGSLVLAREPASHALLASRGIPSLLTADPAFLEPLAPPADATPRRGTLLFLRRRHIARVVLRGRTIELDDRRVTFDAEPLTLASSDPLRDDAILASLAERYGLPYERCFDLPHLARLLAGAQHVVSDRYHPVVFARMLGTPHTFVQRIGSLRDEGLARSLAETPIADLARRAEQGLAALCDFVAG